MEFVQEAITAWRFGHGLLDEDVARLRKLWGAGKEGGVTRPFYIDRTIAAARGRPGKPRRSDPGPHNGTG